MREFIERVFHFLSFKYLGVDARVNRAGIRGRCKVWSHFFIQSIKPFIDVQVLLDHTFDQSKSVVSFIDVKVLLEL